MMEKELEGREGYLVEPEPEVVPAVEGDKPETCPMCGGRCTKEAQSAVEMAMMATPHYRSLVKGEVVAEGDGLAIAGDVLVGVRLPRHWIVYGPCSKGLATLLPARFLVIRAARKEDARTGGKEHG
jgi:hypothetical protein